MKYDITVDAVISPKDRNGTSYDSEHRVADKEDIASSISEMLEHISLSGTIQDTEIYIHYVEED